MNVKINKKEENFPYINVEDNRVYIVSKNTSDSFHVNGKIYPYIVLDISNDDIYGVNDLSEYPRFNGSITLSN